jgi:hypothetical protein
VPVQNAPLPVDDPSLRFIAACGGVTKDKRGNEVLAGLSRVETEWYLANRPARIVIRPDTERSDDEQHWFRLHKRYLEERLRYYPGPRRKLKAPEPVKTRVAAAA